MSLPKTHPPISYSPEKQKEKTLQALVEWLQNVAQHDVVRIEYEDLHWADSSTLEFLALLIDAVPTAQILLLLTFRPEFAPPWPGRAHMLSLQLNCLTPRDIAAMVERVAGKALPEEVMQQLLVKSDGVPLYIEEMTKNLIESDLLTERAGRFELTGPLPALAIPSSLQDSFAARLDRLAPVREIAQIGAVLGREFSYALFQAVSQMQDAKLQDGLQQLSAAEIFFTRGEPPEATYTFKHALLQDAAYASLLKSQRRQFHSQTAIILEQQYAETVETQPELLAHHYTEAGLNERAVPYWLQAGERAAQRSANAEAVGHFNTALKVLEQLPDSPERKQQELTLQLGLGAVSISTNGLAAAEVEQAYGRARELCKQTGDRAQVFPALMGLVVFYAMRAEYATARELSAQLLSMAEEAQEPDLLLEAHFMRGYSLLWTGMM